MRARLVIGFELCILQASLRGWAEVEVGGFAEGIHEGWIAFGRGGIAHGCAKESEFMLTVRCFT